MAAEIPTTEPTEFVAGDTVKWDRFDLADYPISGGWALTYALCYAGGGDQSEGELKLNVTASYIAPASDRHEVRIPASVTALLRPGSWTWTAFATLSAERYTVDSGTLTIVADAAQAGPTETFEETELRAVEAAITQLTDANVQAYSMNGRTFTKLDITYLQNRRLQLLYIVSQQRNPGRGFPSTRVAFVSA